MFSWFRTGKDDKLIRACCDGDVAWVERLLAKGADPNFIDKKGRTALLSAVPRGVTLVELMLAAGADPNVAPGGMSPVSFAVSLRRADVVRTLLAGGADCNNAAQADTDVDLASQPLARHPLIIAVSDNRNSEIVDLLLDAGADANITDRDGFTPLTSAVLAEQDGFIKVLQQAGADTNAPTTRGSTPLMWAVRENQLDTMIELLSSGADPNFRVESGKTAMLVAASMGNTEAMKLLIANGADLHAMNDDGLTALMASCAVGQLEAVQSLIEKGADPNARNQNGITPLHYAARCGHNEVVKTLLSAGANPNIISGEGQTLCDLALESGFDEVAGTLRNATDDVFVATAATCKDAHAKRSTGGEDVLAAELAYQVAYDVIPSVIFGEFSEEDIDKSLTFPDWGSFLYFQHCRACNIVPKREIALMFKTHHGNLDADREYVVIEYPTPKLTFEESGVLSPYFSGIIRSSSGTIDYFVLGQAPSFGRTTFRSVSIDRNANCGPGPNEPDLASFLDRILRHIEISETN